mmetsp:Transcript_21092/g.63392  ORF Transcript_21092/g.63392 Transcript_21092/m.63392 type:complete len:225 (-) Transcript_21092:181-855(-)
MWMGCRGGTRSRSTDTHSASACRACTTSGLPSSTARPAWARKARSCFAASSCACLKKSRPHSPMATHFGWPHSLRTLSSASPSQLPASCGWRPIVNQSLRPTGLSGPNMWRFSSIQPHSESRAPGLLGLLKTQLQTQPSKPGGQDATRPSRSTSASFMTTCGFPPPRHVRARMLSKWQCESNQWADGGSRACTRARSSAYCLAYAICTPVLKAGAATAARLAAG